MAKNPLTNLARFLVAKKQETKVRPAHPHIQDPYRDLLLQIATPLGTLFSDDLDDIDDLFTMLDEEEILSKEAFNLLQDDKEFCEKFEEGIRLGQEEDTYENEEDFMFEDEEWGTEDDYNWPESDEDDEDYYGDEEDEDWDSYEDDEESPSRNPLSL